MRFPLPHCATVTMDHDWHRISHRNFNSLTDQNNSGICLSPCPGFYPDAEDPNSGPHVNSRSTLPTQPSSCFNYPLLFTILKVLMLWFAILGHHHHAILSKKLCDNTYDKSSTTVLKFKTFLVLYSTVQVSRGSGVIPWQLRCTAENCG